MKIKKMAGALALTAALAMGSVPAFAASVSTDTDEFSDNGSTEIKAKVDNVNPNVRATVPLQVTVVFGSNGYGDITGPKASAYKITNIGDGPIYVTEAEITEMNDYFVSDIITDEGDNTYGNSDGVITSGNHLMFTYKTDGNYTYLTTAHPLSAAQKGTTSKPVDSAILGSTCKNFDEEEILAGESLGIELAGKHYFPSAISMDGKSDTLCKIKYTISGPQS